MSQLRYSTTRLWLSLVAVLFSTLLSAPVAASVVETAAGTQVKASCESMAACCCGESLSDSGTDAQVLPPGCDCSLKQAPVSSDPAEPSARAFTMAFGLPVAAALAAFGVVRGPCVASTEGHRPRAGASLRKPSRAPPAGRR